MSLKKRKIKSCVIFGCCDNVVARGLCSKHYKQNVKTKNLSHYKKENLGLSGSLEEYRLKVLSKIEKSTLTECWNWQGCKDQKGYGITEFRREQYRTHRLFYYLFKGELIENLSVLHSCHNPSCCNPDHLRLGTNQDNMDDKVRAGRQNSVRGSKQGLAKLKEENIPQIRDFFSQRLSQEKIAKIFKVSRKAIYDIKIGKTWKHA